MSKPVRQYIGILAAIGAYYLVHEGAHLLCALAFGVFRGVHVMGLGVQIDVFAERMSHGQLSFFCLIGAAATLPAGWILSALTGRFRQVRNMTGRAVLYYCTLAFLLLDPLYLSLLCGFFGGGDMNGIRLLCPEGIARTGFGVLLLGNVLLLRKHVLPLWSQN